jgi:hypothetical protein
VPVTVTAPDVSATVAALDDVGGAAEDNQGKVGFLRGALGDLGLTSLGLGAAISFVTGAIQILTGWFDTLGIKSDITAQGSQAAADSVMGLFDSLTTLSNATFDTTSGLGALNEAFRSGIEAANAGDVDKVSEAFTSLGINLDDLSSTMLAFQTNEGAAVAQLAAGAGATQEFADALGEAATHGDSVNDSFRSLSTDGMRAFGESVGLTGGDVDTYVDKLKDLRDQNALSADQFVNQLPDGLQATGQALVDAAGHIEQIDDAAENTKDTLGALMDELQKSPEGAAALAEVKAAMPDASDAEMLQALVDKLAAIPDKADPAAQALDNVAEPRTADIIAETPGAAEAKATLEDAAADRDVLLTAQADTSAASADIAAIPESTPPVTVQTDADPTGATEAISQAFDTGATTVEVYAHANTQAATSEIDAWAGLTRTADVTLVADTGDMADEVAAWSDQTHTADVTIVADTGDMADEVAAWSDQTHTADVTVGLDLADATAGLHDWTGRARELTVDVEADTSDGTDTVTTWQDERREAWVDVEADTSDGTDTVTTWQDERREAWVDVEADTSDANDTISTFTDRHRQTTITAVALTSSAESELNHTARSRTSTIYVRTVGGGASAAGGGSTRAARGVGVNATAAAPAATSAFAPTIVINAAVIGDRYDVQRVVTRSVRAAVRLGGARQFAGTRG